MATIPNLFIIGAPKSGTTSLYEYLKGHPQVFMSVVKEPCYYARDLARDDSANFLVYGRDEELYRTLFAAAGDAKVVGEASTRYLYSSEAPALIKSESPDARIVAMLRNPVDMIHSLHAHKLAAATEDVADFEAALATEPDRHEGRNLPAHSNPLLATYRDRARFGEQLPRWFETFGRDRVHVIILEDMVRDPASEFRRLLEFLGIDPDYQPESFTPHNTAHGARSLAIRRLLNGRVPQWLVWTLLPRLIGDLRTRALVRRFRHSWFHRRRIEKSSLAPEVRRRLEDEFMPDVRRLSELLGRDLAQLWFKRPATAKANVTARETAPAR